MLLPGYLFPTRLTLLFFSFPTVVPDVHTPVYLARIRIRVEPRPTPAVVCWGLIAVVFLRHQGSIIILLWLSSAQISHSAHRLIRRSLSKESSVQRLIDLEKPRYLLLPCPAPNLEHSFCPSVPPHCPTLLTNQSIFAILLLTPPSPLPPLGISRVCLQPRS